MRIEPPIQRFSLLPPPLDPKSWWLDDGNLGALDLQPDGQWDEFLPQTEDQLENGYDPRDCVSEGYTTCQEILERRLFGTAPEYSERFLATTSGTKERKGNDLHTVAEFGRKIGLVLESAWPSAGVSEDEFFNVPPQSVYDLAKKDHDLLVREHDWIPATKDAIKLALRSSPLSFSVYAWVQNDGIYYEPEGVQDTHVATIYGYTDDYIKVFDSTNPFLKKLDWNAVDGQLKRYTITRRTVYEQQLGLFARILQLIMEYLPKLRL